MLHSVKADYSKMFAGLQNIITGEVLRVFLRYHLERKDGSYVEGKITSIARLVESVISKFSCYGIYLNHLLFSFC